MAATRLHGWAIIAALSAAGCSERFHEPYQLAGGKTIDAATLNTGREAFMLYCYGCHGESGDGKGPSSVGMRPPPRNFHQGLFKFAGVPAGQLPVDSALLRTIRRGLNGTPMLPWDITEKERFAIVQYLKTLSPRWKDEEPPAPTEIPPDPWKGKEAQAIELGKEVYHVAAEGHAGCSGCHASYLTHQEISDLTKKVTGEAVAEFPPEMYRTSLRETEYPLVQDEKGETTKAVQQLPPDFLFHKVKTVYPVGTVMRAADPDEHKPANWVYSEEDQRRDLFRTIGSGVGGAAMPQWKGAIPDENLWALTYYVQSLINIRGTDAAFDLRHKLENQVAWVPPAEEKKPEEAPKAPAPKQKKPAPATNGGSL